MQQIHAQANDLSRIAYLQTPSSTNSPPVSSAINTANPSRTVIEISSSPPESSKQSSPGHASPRRSSREPIALSKKTRGPYVAIACNECRRRKGKCSGGNPCRRCTNLKIPCLYNTSTYRNRRVSDEPQELEDMSTRASPSQQISESPNQPAGSMQDFSTPEDFLEGMPLAMNIPFDELFRTTFMHYGGWPSNQADSSQLLSIGTCQPVGSISENSLHVSEGFDGNDNFTLDFGSGGSIETGRYSAKALGTFSDKASFDPLLEFDQDEIIRLCRLYKDGIGSMYPVLDMESLLTFVRSMSILDLARSPSTDQPSTGLWMLRLKLVMCCALAVGTERQKKKADRMYASVRDRFVNMVNLEAELSTCLDLLVLRAIYHILAQHDLVAGKTIWQLGRSCLEKGLHRKPNIEQIQSDKDRKNALNIFWIAYVFDQQLELNTDLPCIIAEDLIDKELPLPDQDSYLMAIIGWTRLNATVLNHWSNRDPLLASDNSIEILDTEILEWYKALPEEMKVQSPQTRTSNMSVGANGPNLLLFFKLLQIRMSLYATVLANSSSIVLNLQRSERAVSLAKHTIRYLTSLKNGELDYFTKLFHPHLLLSTIAILFLASVYAPAKFRDNCEEAFQASLGLTASLSEKDWPSQRLWEAIKSLKNVAPRYGFDFDECQSMVAAKAMGLSHEHSPRSQVEQPYDDIIPKLRDQKLPEASLDGRQIQKELSHVAETYISPGKLDYKVDTAIFLIMMGLTQSSTLDPQRSKCLVI